MKRKVIQRLIDQGLFPYTRRYLGTLRNAWNAVVRACKVPEERFIEVEARLVSGDGRSSPSLRELVIRLHCPL